MKKFLILIAAVSMTFGSELNAAPIDGDGDRTLSFREYIARACCDGTGVWVPSEYFGTAFCWVTEKWISYIHDCIAHPENSFLEDYYRSGGRWRTIHPYEHSPEVWGQIPQPDPRFPDYRDHWITPDGKDLRRY